MIALGIAACVCVAAQLLALLVRDTVLRLAAIAERGRDARTRDALAAELAELRTRIDEQKARIERLAAGKVLGR